MLLADVPRMLTLITMISLPSLGISIELKACLPNYYITREFGSAPLMVGPLSPADQAYFSTGGPCDITGAETGNANNRRCPNICNSDSCKLGGFQIRMLQIAAEKGGFTFTLDAVPARDKNGDLVSAGSGISQTHIALAELKPSGTCDLWVSPFFITKSRMEAGLAYSLPLIPAYMELVRTTSKQMLSVEESPIIAGFQLYTTNVFAPSVWICFGLLYLLVRALIYMLELSRAGEETWIPLCGGPIYVPRIGMQVLFHIHAERRHMSKYILSSFLMFTFIFALIYEAKMTDVLLTSHKDATSAFNNEEQCLVQDQCCFSVEIFRSLLEEADPRYTGKLRYVAGGEKMLWQEVSAGTCMAGLSTNMRLAKAYRTDGSLCGAIEPVPASTGLFANFQAVPMAYGYATRSDAGNKQQVLDIVNKGLAAAYTYAMADVSTSVFGVYQSHFAKSEACVEQEANVKRTTSEEPLPMAAFGIPFVLMLFSLCCIFWCTCCRCINLSSKFDQDAEEGGAESVSLSRGARQVDDSGEWR